MKCPSCSEASDRVIDSRPVYGGEVIRRRRECTACGRRFTTYERIELDTVRVVKSDGRRVPFSRSKLLAGMLKACEKRPVPVVALEELAEEVERELQARRSREMSTVEIGERVMARLRELDEVAYVRFASVYRRFRDVEEFQREVERLQRSRRSEEP